LSIRKYGEIFNLPQNIKDELESELKLPERPIPPPRSFFRILFGSPDYKAKLKDYEAKCEAKRQAKRIEVFSRQISNKPIRIYSYKFKDYFIYKDNIYKFDRADYSDEQRLLQIMELEDKERRKFEHLKQRFIEAEKIEQERDRPSIPEEVRVAVWRRDGGKCVKCGSRENLEYDHIIPVSKGGSNTVRNIELLCEKCNREKHDNIQ